MAFNSIGKGLVALGVLLVIVGAVVWLAGRAGAGSLPGDISLRRGNTSIYIPIVSSIVISVVLTIVLNLIARFWR
jgi:hypothetical protein